MKGFFCVSAGLEGRIKFLEVVWLLFDDGYYSEVPPSFFDLKSFQNKILLQRTYLRAAA